MMLQIQRTTLHTLTVKGPTSRFDENEPTSVGPPRPSSRPPPSAHLVEVEIPKAAPLPRIDE